jgi:hypothetical protein
MGDGGRPAYRLYTDPDRKIIVAALWYWRRDPEKQRSFAVLQLLDSLFTPYDAIELELGTKEIRGEEFGYLAVTNTAPDRSTDGRTHTKPDRNIAPDRRPLSAPDREAFRKSRLQLLQAKVDRYRNKKLDELEIAYCSHCYLAFELLAIGDPRARFTFATVQWEISEAECKRLAAIFDSEARP